jgi:hypothetical protein
VSFSEPAVVEADHAAVEWHAVTRDRAGAAVELAGVSILRFDGDGLVVEERGYWNVRPEAP